jgi:hypothetical protein
MGTHYWCPFELRAPNHSLLWRIAMDGKLPFFLYSCVLGILLSKRTEHLGATKKKIHGLKEREERLVGKFPEVWAHFLSANICGRKPFHRNFKGFCRNKSWVPKDSTTTTKNDRISIIQNSTFPPFELKVNAVSHGSSLALGKTYEKFIIVGEIVSLSHVLSSYEGYKRKWNILKPHEMTYNNIYCRIENGHASSALGWHGWWP